MATSCCRATSLVKVDKIARLTGRPVDVKCCIVEAKGRMVKIDEETALKLYSPALRFYYMDGNSWGNLLKNVSEKDGIIKQYEFYPCVK